MAYASWSVIFGETPTASKWNVLGANDAFFDDQVGAGLGTTTSTIWYKELDRVTAAGGETTITTGSFTARKHLKIICNIATSGTYQAALRFNGDTSGNYGNRREDDNVSVTANGATLINLDDNSAGSGINRKSIVELFNISAIGKNGHYRTTTGASGSSNAPDGSTGFFRWDNTSAQVTEVTLVRNAGTGTLTANTSIVVLGHD